jgi:DNA-binding FadR family transcriptional regulator
VPSEVQIGRDLEVSRGSVREAYRTLAAVGILEIEGGRRPRLRAIDPNVLTQVFDYALNTAQVNVAHVTETRRALELQTAQFAARYASDAQRRTLARAGRANAISGHGPARRVESDVAIHTVIAEASGNPLNSCCSRLRSPLEASVRIHFDDRRTEVELIRLIDAHEAIVDRICAGDAVGAASAMSITSICRSYKWSGSGRAAPMWCGPAQERRRCRQRCEARRRAFDGEAHGRIAAPLESLRNRSGQLMQVAFEAPPQAARIHQSSAMRRRRDEQF